MKYVHLRQNIVFEIIPDEARPIEEWYNADFAAECVEAPDDVEQGWVYDSKTGKFLMPGSKIPEDSDILESLLDSFIL